MDLDKPLKRRMKIKRNGGEWNWVNFKYERMSLFCFVCGVLGHEERYCSIIYAHLDKEIVRTYGVWLRAPTKNGKSMNIEAKWLQNGSNNDKTWRMHGSGRTVAQFMEVDGRITEIPRKTGGIKFVPRNQESGLDKSKSGNQLEENMGGNFRKRYSNISS